MLKLLLCIGSMLPLANAEELTLQTPRGAELNVSITLPAPTTEKAPALVIAPGQGYHMDLPLVKDFATKAAEQGFIVYRFNWNYFTKTPKGQPAGDLATELEDMQTVITYAKQDVRADAARMVIAGKSLGTLVSYTAFSHDSSILGLVLLTPLCTDYETGKANGEENYPGLTKEARPIAMILGNKDPLCSVPMLYDFLKGTNVSVNVFSGGHSLTIGQFGDPANAVRDARSIEGAVMSASHWAGIFVGN